MRRMMIGLGLVLAAPAAVAQFKSNDVRYLTEYDEEKTTTVAPGTELRIRLRQQGGPGFQWELRSDDRITLLRPPGEVKGGIIGGGSQTEFRLRVNGNGRVTLVFGLRQPGQPPKREIAFDLVVPGGRPDYPDRRPYPGPNRYADDTVDPFTEGDARRSIDVPVGEPQVIALPSNRSAGYRWSMPNSDNVALLAPLREERTRNGSLGDTGGTTIVRFRVIRRGEARITLFYERPEGGAPDKILHYSFNGV